MGGCEEIVETVIVGAGMSGICMAAKLLAAGRTSLVVVEKSGTFDKYWCIARPWASAEVVQAALDWACGHSADCRLIQLAQPCYVPNTLLSHASFAFNSYFQIHGQATGTCDFGGAAMITNIDPSEY